MVVNCGLSGNLDKTKGKQPVCILEMYLVVLFVASLFHSFIHFKYLSQVNGFSNAQKSVQSEQKSCPRHYANMPMHYAEILKGYKNDNF